MKRDLSAMRNDDPTLFNVRRVDGEHLCSACGFAGEFDGYGS
jgi:hypothetical protein